MSDSIRLDYYEKFGCLMGGCRLNCCREGWDIPLMREEYEAMRAAGRREPALGALVGRALGREGSPPGAYAHIRHDRAGACPLCSAEGLCRLHTACGPEALGSVCRTFPRSHVLWNGRHRQCCSAGCQATLALLAGRKEPLRILTGAFVADGWPEHRGSYLLPPRLLARRPLLARLEDLQQQMAALLQQRELPIGARMGRLAQSLYALDAAEQSGTAAGLPPAAESPAFPAGGDLREALAAVALFTTPFFQLGTRQEQEFIRGVWRRCGVEFRQGAQGTELRLDQTAFAQSAARRDRLWQQQAPHLWEHLLVNQMFHDCLPFGDGTISVWDSALYFCAVYAILRFLAAGTAELGWAETEDALVRGLRKYTHSTQLLPRTAEQLKRRGMATPEGLAALLAL